MSRLILLMALAGILGAQTAAVPSDPSQAEVPLPALRGWVGRLVYEGQSGIWCVRSKQLFPHFGCPELIGLDDQGHCTVLVSYSGKWTPFETVDDKGWLGTLAQVDADPRVGGAELYAAGSAGNVFQIVPRRKGGFDTQLIAHFPGMEVHTLLGGDLDPGREGNELIAFMKTGELFLILPNEKRAGFSPLHLIRLTGRVRDALVLPSAEGSSPRIIAVMRAQRVIELRIHGHKVEIKTILREPMGFGRITRRKVKPGAPEVLYTCRDDGVILRLEENGAEWMREIIYAGPQGPRGLISGRFHADARTESVAVFGYSRKIQLISRLPGQPWQVETIFVDRDKGHWLTAAELDGRNNTEELVASGYGKRIIMLSRPPGYGLSGVPTDPDPTPEPTATAPAPKPADETKAPKNEGSAATADAQRPLRIAVPASSATKLSTLDYRGAFATKTPIFETLVRRDQKGAIAPGLASAWEFDADGRRVVFTVRPKATWQDGRPVLARDVALHFKRWLGLPEHAWLGAASAIEDVAAIGEDRLAMRLRRPYALLPDLCAINPCGVEAPGCRDREGKFDRPVGSGTLRYLEGKGTRLHRYRDAKGHTIELAPSTPQQAFKALLKGEVDAIIDDWDSELSRPHLLDLAQREEYFLTRRDGSVVWYLSFSLDGPTEELALRRHVAARIDRQQLVDGVEFGLATACASWAAPDVRIWPRSKGIPQAAANVALNHPLRLLCPATHGREATLARALRDQLTAAGIATVCVAPSDGRTPTTADYDLRLERTWGVPYDPDVSLRARFLPPPQDPSAATPSTRKIPDALRALVAKTAATPDEKKRLPIYREIQDYLDREVPIIPLYTPARLAIQRADLDPVPFELDVYRMDWSSWME